MLGRVEGARIEDHGPRFSAFPAGVEATGQFILAELEPGGGRGSRERKARGGGGISQV